MERELKENELMVSPSGKFGYQITPLTDIQIIVTKEELKAIDNKTKCFDLENNCVVEYDDTEELERQRKQELRAKREPLLKAFDTYKTNIVYGLVEETEEERNDIVAWYKRLLDLDEAAIENVPSNISYYL